jgi:hypothetical protein
MDQEINGENLDLPCSKKIYGEKFEPRVTLCKLLYGRCTNVPSIGGWPLPSTAKYTKFCAAIPSNLQNCYIFGRTI